MEHKEHNCPCCDRHCPADRLSCPKGKAYFEEGEHRKEEMSPEDKAIVLLRKCGHFLHHSAGRGTDASFLMSALTEEERKELEILLEKCLESWSRLQP